MEELYDGEENALEVVPFNSWTSHWCAEDMLLMDVWNKLKSAMLHEFWYWSSLKTKTNPDAEQGNGFNTGETQLCMQRGKWALWKDY